MVDFLLDVIPHIVFIIETLIFYKTDSYKYTFRCYLQLTDVEKKSQPFFMQVLCKNM